MKVFKKVLLVSLSVLLLLISGLVIAIFFSGPKLPTETDDIIEQIRTEPLTEMVTGQQGYALSGKYKIWYESIVPHDSIKGTVLLIMGINNDALSWSLKFIHAFVASGYRVIRCDHRGTGMSDWIADWDSNHPYSLNDMAKDNIAVLNTLQIDRAHLLGVSMGGMVAQELAIHYPERVSSLNSIMSSGYIEDPDLPKISTEIAGSLIKAALKYGIIGGEKNLIKLFLASRIILRGKAKYEIDIKEIAQQVLYNVRKRKGFNARVSKQHQAAVHVAGSRYQQLPQLRIPTLIIHGLEDPFIPIEHSKKCVSLIPNSDSMYLQNMAHDIPDFLIDTIVKRCIKNFNRN